MDIIIILLLLFHNNSFISCRDNKISLQMIKLSPKPCYASLDCGTLYNKSIIVS